MISTIDYYKIVLFIVLRLDFRCLVVFNIPLILVIIIFINIYMCNLNKLKAKEFILDNTTT